jgi:hypothetical protein
MPAPGIAYGSGPSAADMLSHAPADLFAGIDDISPNGETVEDGNADDALDTAPVEDTPIETVDEPPQDAAPADTAPPDGTVPDKTAAPAAEEDLPEGVIKTKDAKGRPYYRLDENRYKTVYGNHQMVRQLSEQIGEPATIEALQLRNEAYLAQERLFTGLESGDPNQQAPVVRHMLDEMRTAYQDGAVGNDPTVPFAESIYHELRSDAKNQAPFARIQQLAANDILGHVFAAAANTGNEKTRANIFNSARHIVASLTGNAERPADMPVEQYLAKIKQDAAALGLPFPTDEELSGFGRQPTAPRLADPRDREIAELRAQIAGRSAPSATERYSSWYEAHVKDVNKAVLEEAVMPSLASVKDGWKDFPDDFNRLVIDPLNREVAKKIRTDEGLNQRITELQSRAKRATSEQVRTAIGTEIRNLLVHRATIEAEKANPPMLKFAADWLKGRSNRTHERRADAQQRTQPKGPSTPVKTSLLPQDLVGMKGNIYDPKVAFRQAAALLGAGR